MHRIGEDDVAGIRSHGMYMDRSTKKNRSIWVTGLQFVSIFSTNNHQPLALIEGLKQVVGTARFIDHYNHLKGSTSLTHSISKLLEITVEDLLCKLGTILALPLLFELPPTPLLELSGIYHDDLLHCRVAVIHDHQFGLMCAISPDSRDLATICQSKAFKANAKNTQYVLSTPAAISRSVYEGEILKRATVVDAGPIFSLLTELQLGADQFGISKIQILSVTGTYVITPPNSCPTVGHLGCSYASTLTAILCEASLRESILLPPLSPTPAKVVAEDSKGSFTLHFYPEFDTRNQGQSRPLDLISFKKLASLESDLKFLRRLKRLP